jgi:hypothetical protein
MTVTLVHLRGFGPCTRQDRDPGLWPGLIVRDNSATTGAGSPARRLFFGSDERAWRSRRRREWRP